MIVARRLAQGGHFSIFKFKHLCKGLGDWQINPFCAGQFNLIFLPNCRSASFHTRACRDDVACRAWLYHLRLPVTELRM